MFGSQIILQVNISGFFRSTFICIFCLVLNPRIYSQCSTSVVPPATINGVYITETYTGSVSRYLGAYVSCSGSNTANTPPNSLWLGSQGAFDYTMKFNMPINNLVIVITASGQGANENFIFTTNNGKATITMSIGCNSTINGNEILSGAGAQVSGGGGGIFTISDPGGNYTSLTIKGAGGQNGSLVAVCSSSVTPAPKKPSYNSLNLSICHRDSVKVGKHWYKKPGTYKDTFVNYVKMDSILTTNLSYKANTFVGQVISICPGSSYSIGKRTYNMPNIYNDTFKAYKGCDSIVTTDLRFLPKSYFSQALTLCIGESLKVNKRTYTANGIYKDTFISNRGCDSIVTTTLTFNPKSSFTHNITICEGEQCIIGSSVYTTGGTFADITKNYWGCDSIITTNLTVIPKPVVDFSFKDDVVNTDDVILFTNLSNGADRYHWQFGTDKRDSSNLTSPVFTFLTDGIKRIMLAGINNITGCKDTIYKNIEVLDNTMVCIPIAFTPNADGLNDQFFAASRNYDVVEMRILNRWGEILFETKSLGTGWDGTYKGGECQQDVYLYVIELTNTKYHKTRVFKGTLTLLR